VIFKDWTPLAFRERGFVEVPRPLTYDRFVRLGVPVYSAPGPSKIYAPGWVFRLLHAATDSNSNSTVRVDALLAAVVPTAIRHDDPDAFVESALAAYALGGFDAALQLAAAQGGAHAVGPA
jgi:hypothetical protein